MQQAPALAFVPRPSSERPTATQLAEFRFESNAALERALALAAGQSWIASYAVDRARRILRVTLAVGCLQAGVLAPRAERASIH